MEVVGQSESCLKIPVQRRQRRGSLGSLDSPSNRIGELQVRWKRNEKGKLHTTLAPVCHVTSSTYTHPLKTQLNGQQLLITSGMFL